MFFYLFIVTRCLSLHAHLHIRKATYLLVWIQTVKLVLVLFDNDNELNEGEEGDMCVHYHYHGCRGAKEHLLV